MASFRQLPLRRARKSPALVNPSTSFLKFRFSTSPTGAKYPSPTAKPINLSIVGRLKLRRRARRAQSDHQYHRAHSATSISRHTGHNVDLIPLRELSAGPCARPLVVLLACRRPRPPDRCANVATYSWRAPLHRRRRSQSHGARRWSSAHRAPAPHGEHAALIVGARLGLAWPGDWAPASSSLLARTVCRGCRKSLWTCLSCSSLLRFAPDRPTLRARARHCATRHSPRPFPEKSWARRRRRVSPHNTPARSPGRPEVGSLCSSVCAGLLGRSFYACSKSIPVRPRSHGTLCG